MSPHEDVHGTPSACPAGQVRRITPSAIFAILVVAIYTVLSAALFSPTMFGFVLGIGLHSASYLVIYLGIPLTFLSWVLLMVYSVFIRKERLHALWTGAKLAVITFGVMGMLFWLWGMIPPTARTFTLGYWLHVKVWADVDEIRMWAGGHQAVHDGRRQIPQEQWPSSLRRMPVSLGCLQYDANSSTVTFYEGGGFGHWGLTVAPKGTPVPDGWCIIQLEDGAWVWHELQ